MIEPKELPEFDQSQVTNISHAEVGSVHAELVRMHQADAGTIQADEVELQQSAAGSVKANQVSAHQTAMAMVEAGEVHLQDGLMGFARAEKISVGGYTGLVVAGNAEVHHAMAGFVAGREMHVEESRTVFLIARNMTGNVTTLMDTRSALIAGLVSGLFASIMLLLGHMLFGRK
jgi:hypothetical protein